MRGGIAHDQVRTRNTQENMRPGDIVDFFRETMIEKDD
jgi:hypothetical protein